MIFAKRTKSDPVSIASVKLEQSPALIHLQALQQQQQHVQQLQQQTHDQHRQQQLMLWGMHTALLVGVLLAASHSLLCLLVSVAGMVMALQQYALHLHAREQYLQRQQQLEQLQQQLQQYVSKQQRFQPRYAAHLSQGNPNPAEALLPVDQGAWQQDSGHFAWIWLLLWLAVGLSFVHVPWGLPLPQWLG